MDWLRWILLLLGCALIAAIYFSGAGGGSRGWRDLVGRWGRRGERAPEPSPARAEPSLDEPDAPELHVDAGRPGSFEPGPAAADPFADEPAGATGPEPAPDAADARGPPEGGEEGLAEEGDPAQPHARDDAQPAGGPAATDAEPAPRAPAGASADEPAPAEAAPAARGASEAAPQRGARRSGGRAEDGGTAPPGDDERLVILYLVAQRGERLVGARLAEAFARHGLRHGELGIFHATDSEGRTVFSIANLVEPGSFDLATMDTLSTPGVALFTRLPGPQTAQTAFDRMVSTGRELAEELGAHLLDSDHSTLTRQTEQHLRDELREFDLRRGGARS